MARVRHGKSAQVGLGAAVVGQKSVYGKRWPDDPMSRSVGGGPAAAGLVVVRQFVLLLLPQPKCAVRGQAGIADLIQQRAIADAQRARRLFAVQ